MQVREFMFDREKPLIPQILIMMDKMGCDDDAIAYAREQLEIKKNFKFAEMIVNILGKLQSAEKILAEKELEDSK